MIARGPCHHRLAIEPCQDIQGSTDLERPGPLHALGLEKDVASGESAEGLGPNERSLGDIPLEAGPRLLDVGEGDHRDWPRSDSRRSICLLPDREPFPQRSPVSSTCRGLLMTMNKTYSPKPGD